MLREVITRAEAKERGLARYYTGKPCPKSHDSERRTANSVCIVCMTLASRLNRKVSRVGKEGVRRRSKNFNAQPRVKEHKKRRYSEKLAEKFGLAPDAWLSRPHICEICMNKCKTVLDHDHSTGNFRGWLCDPCNRTLGLLRDDCTILRNMVQYLENFKASLPVEQPRGG